MELIDITDTLVFDDEPSIFDEETALDLIESALHLMEDYLNENPTAVSEPDFHETMLEEIQDIFALQFEDHTNNDFSDYMEDDLNELLEEAFDIFINTYNIERTPESASITDDDEIVERIDYLRSKPQPDQRTKEWYEFRHNLITASNAYKAFESQAMVNQLIYEKCQPIKSGNDDKLSMVNVNTTFHWGQKYEPLSVMIYEDMYNTKVEDFGCIQHDTHNFLGASPDGINVDKTSDRYGRMLEIKNIVNREITGIPKKEYWIQTQLQMEVCDLNECDFLETKFTEYETANDFFNDETDKKKGIILYFNTKEGKPFYIYKPLDILTVDEITEWEQETIDKHQANNMMWIKNLYWKLEIMSCVLILRNRKWFEDNIEQLGKVWKIIEEERITGYQHRAPNKRIKKEIHTQVTEGCLLDLTKFTPLKN